MARRRPANKMPGDFGMMGGAYVPDPDDWGEQFADVSDADENDDEGVEDVDMPPPLRRRRPRSRLAQGAERLQGVVFLPGLIDNILVTLAIIEFRNGVYFSARLPQQLKIHLRVLPAYARTTVHTFSTALYQCAQKGWIIEDDPMRVGQYRLTERGRIIVYSLLRRNPRLGPRNRILRHKLVRYLNGKRLQIRRL